MTPPTATSIHCPSCGRYLTKAEEIKGQELKCRSCGTQLRIDLQGGVLTVVPRKPLDNTPALPYHIGDEYTIS